MLLGDGEIGLGELHVLNAQRGGLTINFDDPEEAAKIIRTLIREGHSILIQDDQGKTARALGVDDSGTYFVAQARGEDPEEPPKSAAGDKPLKLGYGTCPECRQQLKVRLDGKLPLHKPAGVGRRESVPHCPGSQEPPIEPVAPRGTRRVPARKSRGTAIAPSAGG